MSKWMLTTWIERVMSGGSVSSVDTSNSTPGKGHKVPFPEKNWTLFGVMILVSLLLSSFLPCALADQLNDGYPDVIFTNSKNVHRGYGIDSYIYWGDESGSYSTLNRGEIGTQSGHAVSVADFNNDGQMDISCSNNYDYSTTVRNSYIYWGAATDPYSPDTRALFPTKGAKGQSAADLNGDGYLDIVVSNNFQIWFYYETASYIYWGAATDPYTTKTNLPTKGADGNAIADLNNDGYYDIIFANQRDDDNIKNLNSYIYWGAATDPYTTKMEIPTSGAKELSVADLDKNGYLDIVISNANNGTSTAINSYIYWGSETGSYTTKTELSTHQANGNSVADLNNDGYLDIVFSNHNDGTTQFTNSYIYWGAGSDAFSSRTDLPTVGAHGNAVGDLNKDGYLDIVFANYRADGAEQRDINSYIYWGAATDPYSIGVRTELPTKGAIGVTISENSLFSANEAYGNVIPLWATEGNYDDEVLNSWQYGFMATQNELLNEGALDFSDEEIAQLAKLYFDQSGSVVIDGTTWRYYSDEIGGRGVPEAWYEDGEYYFQMGSGVTTEPVPEPSTIIIFFSLLILLMTWHIRRPRSTAVKIDNKNLKKARSIMKTKELLIALCVLVFLMAPFTASADQFTILHHFLGPVDDGRSPMSGVTYSDGEFYGMTYLGGDNNVGLIYQISTDGSGFTVLHDFVGGASGGSKPYGDVTISGSMLYGMTSNGGNTDKGTIFRSDTDGTGFTLLHEFMGGVDDGSIPFGDVTLIGSNLYGMTTNGGNNNFGTIFRIDTGGGGFTLLHEFTDGADNGRQPSGSLSLSGSYFYGMTQAGGDSSAGVVFRIDTAGGDFTLLHEFVGGGSDGSMPYGDLLLSGSNMYGMTYWGGDLDRGTIFMIGVDGSGFTLLHELAGGADDGRKPRGSLALSEGVLYGVSEYGGDSNFGALFQINTDGTGFTMLHDFVGGANDGTFPDYVTLNILENKLYGTASGGGDSDYGVIFSFATSEGEVPEPSTLLLLLPFILGLRWMIKKKKMLMILLCLFVTLSLCITTSPANALDLDDAYPDIVFGNFNGPEGYVSNSVVYWGDSSRASSFATYKQLNTRGAMGTAVADVNQDEKLDVVLSNYSEGAPLHRNINSYVYWGETLTSRKELDTYGAKGVSVGDINDDGYYDIVYSNYQAASSFEHNSYVYWGDSSSSYPSKTLLATKGAVGNKIVDLNEDGYLDVIFANYVDNVSRNTLSTIYWGPGPAFASSTNFATSGARDVSVADLNNDDYLDLVISGYHNDTTHAMNSKIYWGDSSYLYASGMDLPTVGAMGNSVGDLNKDGYLDIVFSNHKTDANNYLINSYIYWGAESNPYTSKTELATVGADGNAIGDIDKDGYVDIVFANFTNGTSRQINSYIYWGDESCTYASKTELLTGGAEGVTIVGGNVSTGVSAYGNVVPMWFTQNDYDSGVLDSWQYSFIGTQYELLNSGALDFSDEEIYQLAELYFNQTGSVEIDGITWTYFSEEQPGHEIPEAWYDSGTYYFQMGSGLEGEGEGEVPEPSTILLLLPFIGMYVWRKHRSTKR